MIGQTLGHYRIETMLGSGGMGEVYRAYDTKLQRDVAVKVLSTAPDKEGRALLLREARAASALTHPSVCVVHDVQESEGRVFLVMEYIAGRPLAELIPVGGLPVEAAAGYGLQIADALVHAHERGVIHRDLKSANVMITPEGRAKVLDFGLARRLDEPGLETLTRSETSPAEAGAIAGTLAYMAPEVLRGEPANARSDLWALGILLYEMTTGARPFGGRTVFELCSAVLREPLPPVRSRVSRALRRVIERCLAKDPGHRYQRAGEVRAALETALATASAVSRTSRRDRKGGVRERRAGAAAPSHSSAPAAPARRQSVGREAERAALRGAFDEVARGRGLLVGIAGEPGLGKTTLVEEFLADLGDEGRAGTLARGRCSERLAGTEAYLPVLEALDSLARADAQDALALLRAVAPTWYAQLAPLKEEDPSDARLLADVKAASQERLKREFVAFLSEAGRLRPLVLFLDDVHWADASTIDLVAYLADRFDKARCLVVTTYRPTELALAKHPFATLKLDLSARGVGRELALDFLTPEDVEHYLALEFPGHHFPPAFQEVIHARTEGNPLFVADLLRYLRARQVIGQEQGHWVVTQPMMAIERELPASVRSMIQRKLDQVAEEDRRLLVAASVEGQDFDSAVVARALGLDAADVEDRFEALARIHALVHRAGERMLPDGTLNVRYRFMHVLYQNALYDSVAPTRRASLSRAIADALAGYYGERRAEIASTLALLFEAARDLPRAIEHFQVAAVHAMQVFAYHETVGVASRGLHLLESLPDTPERLRKELDLQLLLGAALTATQGWGAPELQRTYARAQELSETAGEPPELFPALFGLASFYTVRAEYQTVQKIAERLMRIAEKAQDPGLLLLAHWTTAWTWWMQGEFGRSRSHHTRSDSLYVPAQHHALSLLYGVDPGVGSLISGALVQWHLGYADQSLTAATTSLTHAGKHGHPFTVVYALGYALMLHQLRREPQAVRERLEPFMTLVTEHQFTAFYLPWGTFFRGWALAEEGEVQEGILQMQQALDEHRFAGGELYRPAFLALLAEACGKAGRPDEALGILAQALSLVEARGERQHEAEIHRIKGNVLLRRDPPDQEEANRCFQQALAVARRQQAKLPELRAAVSLGRLWQAQGRPDEARALVGSVYAWFTEGFDTVDLREAKAFVAE